MTEEAFLRKVLARHPEWERWVSRVTAQAPKPWTAVVEVPSPTDDPERALTLWVDAEEPSIGFGSQWHTHTADMSQFWGVVDAILADELVLAIDLGGQYDGFVDVLDLRSQDAVLERLTTSYAPEQIQIQSFSGAVDRLLP